MTLTKNLQRLKDQLLTKLKIKDIDSKLRTTLGILVTLALIVWIIGPHIAWGDYIPLAKAEKRFYAILLIFLCWALKYILVDQSKPDPAKYAGETLQKKLHDIQQRFHGAIEFLNKTRITRNNLSTRLDELPWYLLIGPANAGKTTLLANSGINFILQRRQQQNAQHPETAKHFDWWVTRDTSIIDVPGKYLSSSPGQDPSSNFTMWEFFLRLIRFQRGKNAIKGIIIALPLPELLFQGNQEYYQTLLHDLHERTQTLRQLFFRHIPCQIVITKCDLLPGFTEFFADCGNDEAAQAWNVVLTTPGDNETIADVFANRFNILIKKLNQQLIWRLHRERDPMTRPYIKDFPLQIEFIKEFILDFITKFTADNQAVTLKGVYLTSALQEARIALTDIPVEECVVETDNITPINTREHAVQIFREQTPASRAYFIKSFISHGLGSTADLQQTQVQFWQRRSVQITSVSVLTIVAGVLAHDFRQGMKQADTIADSISNYQVVIRKIQDTNEHFTNTLNLLNSLQTTENSSGYKIDLSRALSFYSKKSQQKTVETYQQALQSILIPEMQNYFADYLNIPVNKNPEYVYLALKAYLMMGDPAHFQPDFILNSMRQVMPDTLNNTVKEQLLKHMSIAISSMHPLPLNSSLIAQTRTYFAAMPSYQLGYILLKNMSGNNDMTEINLTPYNGIPAFTSDTIQNVNQIPKMFLAASYPVIINQDCIVAAREALTGNWALGDNLNATKNLAEINTLIEQLRNAYLNNYIVYWEGVLNRIIISTPTDLAQTDSLIISMISNNSPLLQLLQTLHDNTYFEPVASSSVKLQNLGLLLEDRNQTQNLLYQIFSSLQYLHVYLQTVLTAQDERKAAFVAVSNRMLSRGTPDAITGLRLVAVKSPAPVKIWLEQIANSTWHYLMQDASNYIDTSWQDQVIRIYQTDIANRYPFSTTSEQEVAIQNFVNFFGNPGAVPNFYNVYLRQFVDASAPEWHWKTVDGMKMPFADENLRQIQYAMRIHHTFFPNDDNKIFVEFSLQPYQLGNQIKSVKLNINDKQFVDERNGGKDTHIIAWPFTKEPRKTSVQLTLNNRQIITHDFNGDWGWFKLLNQSFENIITRKEILLNLSKSEQPAKYLLFMNGQYNPFMALNLNHFHLPQQLSEEQKV